MGEFREMEGINTPYDIMIKMNDLHRWLMDMGFPYSSVSVIYRPQDIGVCCIFSDKVRDKVSKNVIDFINSHNSAYYINQPPASTVTAEEG